MAPRRPLPGASALHELLPALHEAHGEAARGQQDHQDVRCGAYAVLADPCQRRNRRVREEELRDQYAELDPVFLLEQIRLKQNAFWRHNEYLLYIYRIAAPS